MKYKMTPRFDNVSQLKFLHGYKDLPHNDNRDRGIIRLNFDESECLWRSVKATTGRIFVIGRRHGGSTVLLAAAAGLEREVVSVDIDPKHHEVCQQFFDHKEFGKNIILYIANSIKIVPGNLGLLFIDGDHSYVGCRRDIITHWRNLDIGGLCVFHDAVPNEGLRYSGDTMVLNHEPGVAVAAAELIVTGRAAAVDSAGSVLVLKKLK